MKHVLYQKGDKNIPSQLLDVNGDVVLSMCKICGKAESELSQECKSDREKAIEWFSKFSSFEKTQLCDTHTELVGSIRRWETLTGREIEQIWQKETKQEKEGMPQVDFELLKTFKEDFTNLSNLNPVLKIGWIKESLENMYLFVELLSKSSTFSHKAHKELNKLMK